MYNCMPVVWPDRVLVRRNVVQVKRVGGYTRQAKAGGAPFTEEPEQYEEDHSKETE